MRELPAPGIPSYGQGFARSAAEAEYPHRWDGLRGFWARFLGPTGQTLFDSGGYKSHGTPGATWPASSVGPYGYALDFDGVTNQVAVGNPTALQIPGAITVGVRFRIHDLTAHRSLVIKGKTFGGPNSYDFGLNFFNGTPDKLYWQCKAVAISISADFSSTDWTIAFGTWDGTTGANGATLYIDGDVAAQGAATSTVNDTDQDLSFGYGSTGTAYPLDGEIDFVGIWIGCKPASWIKAFSPEDVARLRRRVFAAVAAGPAGTILPQMIQQGLYTGAI